MWAPFELHWAPFELQWAPFELQLAPFELQWVPFELQLAPAELHGKTSSQRETVSDRRSEGRRIIEIIEIIENGPRPIIEIIELSLIHI